MSFLEESDVSVVTEEEEGEELDLGFLEDSEVSVGSEESAVKEEDIDLSFLEEPESEEVLEALLQFMKLFPYMSGGHTTSGHTPVYAFGESYGGSYVISLAKVYLNYR